MKPENPAYVKRNLTDADRNTCLKLLNCGLSVQEIIDIMHISRSTIYFIKQAHIACLNKDWSTIQKLSTESRPTVDWAMKITGVDKLADEIFGKPKTEEPVAEPVAGNAPSSTADTDKIYKALADICSLLTEIRDIIK